MEVKSRVDLFRKDLCLFLDQAKKNGDVDYNTQANGSKVCIVGHSMFLRVFTTEEAYWNDIYNSETYNKFPPDNMCHLLMNCEIYPDLLTKV